MPVRNDEAMPLQIAGESMLLLGERAMYWEARRRLIIADLHLGKAHAFRRAGIAIPRGTTQADLRRLTELRALTGARELWIVGDVLHGPSAPADWMSAWKDWRKLHGDLEVAVLAGNHDRLLANAGLEATMLGNRREDGPFVFRHHPEPDVGGRHVIAGHLHPKIRVAGVRRSWPAFWLRPGISILPAFSDFTGGATVVPGKDDLLIACVEGSVFALAKPLSLRLSW